MSEEMLVRHCSPTLMGLKTGNMFSCRFETKEEEHKTLTKMNKKLTSKGLRAIPLKHNNHYQQLKNLKKYQKLSIRFMQPLDKFKIQIK